MQDAGHTLGPVASTSTQTTDPQPGSEVVPTHPPIEPASSSTQGQVLLTADPTICADPGARETAWFDHEFLDAGTLVERDLGGGGLAVADFDGDGWLDLFTASARPALWRSIGGTTFAEDPTSVAGIDLVGAVGASAADADDDGDVDVLVTRWNAAPILLINDGTGQWSDGTAHAGLGSAALGAGGSSWADFDGDGDLDLIIAGYGAHPPDPYDPLMPPGAPSRLYRANGDGSFEDASTLLPAATLDAYAFQHAWFDLDLDGLPELFTAADYGWIRPSTLLRNLGGAFEDAPEFGFLPEYAAMGVGVGDLGGDGLPDFAITSVKDLALMETLSLPGNSVVYVDRADARGIRLNAGSGSPIGQDFGWGVELVDVGERPHGPDGGLWLLVHLADPDERERTRRLVDAGAWGELRGGHCRRRERGRGRSWRGARPDRRRSQSRRVSRLRAGQHRRAVPGVAFAMRRRSVAACEPRSGPPKRRGGRRAGAGDCGRPDVDGVD